MSGITDLLRPYGASEEAGMPGSSPFVLGTVSDNGDKEHANMVRVEFTGWASRRNICDWIPLLHPYAGAEYGVYLTPEVGDIVLVGFIGAGCEKPFVLGCLFPAEARMASESFTERNTARRLRTRGGVEVSISDEEDKQSVLVTTPGGLALRLDDGSKSVSLCDGDGKNQLTLDCQNGEVRLKADAKLVLEAGGCSLTLDGQAGKGALACDEVSLNATRQATVSSDQVLSLEGGMLKAEGKQTAQFKGGTMAELSAGVVKIN